MFDGTDLAGAYGTPTYDLNPPMLQPPAMGSMNDPSPPKQFGPGPTSNPATASRAVAPDAPYQPPEAMYANQSAKPPAYLAGPSFWDRLVMRRVEVIKLIGLALVILLAISLDRVSTHYLTTYIGGAFLTPTQELLMRLGYPVVVLVILWFMKAWLAA
jgi:hypothetical protein